MRKEYLKIRDDVDLKELEKFGFRKHNKGLNVREHYALTEKTSRITTKLYAWVDCENRTIGKGTWTEDGKYGVILFDLISAGLVEKVVEDE